MREGIKARILRGERDGVLWIELVASKKITLGVVYVNP